MGNGIEKVVSAIESVIKKINIPLSYVPPTLLYCTAIKRSGGSPMKTTAEIINDMETLGMNTGPNEDGSENVMNQFVYCVVRRVYDMISRDMVGQGATLANTIPVNGFTAAGEAFTGSNSISVSSLILMR